MTTFDLSDPSKWHTWTGNELNPSGSGAPPLPCLLNNGVGDYQRHVSRQTFQTPFTFTGWFEWLADNDPSDTPHNGIHLGLTQDNDYAYHLSFKHGLMDLLVESKGYSRLTASRVVPELKPDGVRHQFMIRIPDVDGRITATMDYRDVRTPHPSSNGGYNINEDLNAHHAAARLLSGRIGLRLDRQKVKLGALVVTTN